MAKRFERLLIPQVGWALIYWGAIYINSVLIEMQFEIGISDVIWQILSGHSPKLNETMWYQTNLIILTVFFLITITIFERNYELIFWAIALAALFVQYSEMNMFFDSWRYELKYPLGRLIEMIPIAVVGFMISSTGLLEKIRNQRLIVSMISISLIWLDERYNMFLPVKGYGYSGIRMIVLAWAFISLFYVFPFEKVNEKIKIVISFLTKYTMGIYCMHRLISLFFTEIIDYLGLGIVVGSFSFCIIIYILCYVCAWSGDILLGKTKMKALFL